MLIANRSMLEWYMVYHTVPQKDWDKALKKKKYAPSSLKSAGYIHCSTIDQIISISHLVYKKRSDLLILEIDESKVQARIVSEDIKGHGRFPHIYGPLNIDAVIHAYPLLEETAPGAAVSFRLPFELIQPPVPLN